MTKEIWKPCNKIGFSRYEVSNKGRIRNIKSMVILKGIISRGGYHALDLVNNKGNRKNVYAHTMVARIFIGSPKKGETSVDHINRIKLDNSVSNLRWSTPKMQANNTNHRKTISGRPVYQLDKDTHEIIKKWDKITDAGIFFKISKNGCDISRSCKDISNTTHGFRWQYVDDWNIDENEKWKSVPHHNKFDVDNIYASNFGRIKRNERIYNGSIDKGYKVVHIQERRYFIHRLVAATFIGINNDLYVNHKDGIKTNNKSKNLEYCTPKENAEHAYSLGLVKKKKVPVNQYNMHGKFIKKHNSMKGASKALEIKPNNICAVCKGNQKSAGGYIWKYAKLKHS